MRKTKKCVVCLKEATTHSNCLAGGHVVAENGNVLAGFCELHKNCAYGNDIEKFICRITGFKWRAGRLGPWITAYGTRRK